MDRETSYTPEEIEAHRRAWIAALRSGEYEQCAGSLRRNGRYCCLGVACEISGAGAWTGPSSYDTTFDYLPDSVIRWLGVEDHDPYCDTSFATGMNDGGMRFADIAEAFEAHWGLA